MILSQIIHINYGTFFVFRTWKLEFLVRLPTRLVSKDLAHKKYKEEKRGCRNRNEMKVPMEMEPVPSDIFLEIKSEQNELLYQNVE